MSQFLFGCVVGGVIMSVCWLAYIAYFPDDVTSMGGRLRRWVKKRIRR
jgi:hypothetical protein